MSHSDRSGRAKSFDHARDVALETLVSVEESDAYANLLLPVLLRERGLAGKDAALATELAFGTLRLQGRYDPAIALAADRPVDRIDPPLLCALRMGVHQIWDMNVPDYAAVSETVTLVNHRFGGFPGKFVNAVLRGILARSREEWRTEAYPDPNEQRVPYLAAEESHPEWIIRAFTAALRAANRDPSELESLLQADNTAPPVSLVARPGRITQAELIAASGSGPGRYSPWAVRSNGDPGALEAVATGAAGVQDEGSQLMALALSRAEIDTPDTRWLDMCAGPGGKAADLAGLASDEGAELVAVEQHPHRAELVRRSLTWQGQPQGEVIVGDAVDVMPRPGSYSRILVDAPCTGLGAIRRRPESRWRRQANDVPGLVSQQRRLLLAALDAVAPGGVVAYVTCSPHVAETDRIVDHALKKRPEVVELESADLLPEVPDASRGKRVQLWPHVHGTDGMFLALLRRPA